MLPLYQLPAGAVLISVPVQAVAEEQVPAEGLVSGAVVERKRVVVGETEIEVKIRESSNHSVDLPQNPELGGVFPLSF